VRQLEIKVLNIIDARCNHEVQNTHFIINNFFPENRAIYEIMWKNVLQSNRLQMTI